MLLANAKLGAFVSDWASEDCYCSCYFRCCCAFLDLFGEGKELQCSHHASLTTCGACISHVSLNRWDPDCRMTPAQALDHRWLRTAVTSTTGNATTTATPGRVQCFGAAERR